ncbi:hypothetical protein VIN30_07075 [Adlercreutzia sp. R7]|uniref:Uncharacterized protein n=1 Tax=Adlercreutzia wanghongyangiae TaxID=3111451 RepID=A0ABU6IIF4_9ACTN|nr:hypothetical protein [Adlercreutzia sp. R7]
MFAGEPVATILHVKDCATSAVAGRLSAGDASVANANGTASVYATVMENPTSYGWLTQFGSDMAIEKSASLQESHLEYLRDIEAAYG